MQGWHYGKGLIYYRLIFRLTKLVFLRASIFCPKSDDQSKAPRSELMDEFDLN